MKRLIPWIIISLIFLAGCSSTELLTRNYYILEYYPHSEDADLKQTKPLDITAVLLDTQIRNAYNRKQIVVRNFGPRITYLDNDLWGVKLNTIIPDLCSKRLIAYNLFSKVHRQYTKEPGRVWEIGTRLNNIELYQSEFEQQAHVNIDFSVKENGAEILAHTVNVERQLPDDSVDMFVQTVNEIILDAADEFAREVVRFSANEDGYCPINPEENAPLDNVNIQPLAEAENTEKGYGILLVPALTHSDNEPYFIVKNERGEQVASEPMGTDVALPAGRYSVLYGSGSLNQMIMKTNIIIRPRYKTVVEPDWGCLIVDVMDESRNYAKVRFEIWDMETGESFGSEFPAEKEIGEQPVVWALRPGLYKVTINNEPFNTLRDFTTVFVEPNDVQELRIVVDVDEDGNPLSLVGSGVLEDSERTSGDQRLKINSAIHGNVNFNSSNELDENNPEYTITLNTQLETQLTYNINRFHYTLKNVVDMGTTKKTDTDFQISSDSFDWKNTLVYYFIKNLGFYSRFDLLTHFLNEYSYSTTEFNYKKYNNSGELISTEIGKDKIQVKKSLLPLNLKEGIGLNFRLFDSSKATLNIRSGLGLRQDIYNDVYGYETTIHDTLPDLSVVDYRIYKELESTDKLGTEMSLVGNFKVLKNLTYSTTADVLFPFNKEDDVTIEWENSFNMKLVKHISLDYKLNLRKTGDSSIIRDDTLFLRVTYFLR
ncbi:MAG: DUF481 domain-containing protein [Candidatus Cloacimonetes bacterium]|nr:DUF481 domain-containing protein [Candidatus Cloacimonadota bacterium]